MDTMRVEREGKVAIAVLDNGVINAIGPDLVAELSETLQDLRGDDSVGAVILTSANDKFFSIGLEIPALLQLSKPDFRNFYKAFNRLCIDLFRFPKPTYAAISGHATAGGCVLALCCDHRIIAEGRKLMGLNEIKLGVPLPYPIACILREIAGAVQATAIAESGELFPPDALLKMSLVDRVLPLEEVRSQAIAAAEKLACESTPAFRAIKQSRIEVVLERISSRLNEKEEIFVNAWCSEETQVRLSKAAEKF